MSTGWRWLACVPILVAAVVSTPGLARALEVQACLARSGDAPLDITSDPAQCEAAKRVDATAASISVLSDLFADAVRQPLLLTKNVDQASALLFLHATRSAFFRNVLVVFFEGNGTKRGKRLLSILLTTAWIKRLSQGGQDQKSGAPIETVELEYFTLEIRDDVTGVSACWDFENDKAC